VVVAFFLTFVLWGPHLSTGVRRSRACLCNLNKQRPLCVVS